MSERKTQLEVIESILRREGRIDNFRAIHDRISLRLGARIWDLRSRGFQIETKELPDKNTVYTLISSPGAPGKPTFDGFLAHLNGKGFEASLLSPVRRAELYQEYVRTCA